MESVWFKFSISLQLEQSDVVEYLQRVVRPGPLLIHLIFMLFQPKVVIVYILLVHPQVDREH